MIIDLNAASLTTHLPIEALENLTVLAIDAYMLDDSAEGNDSPMGDRIREHLQELFEGDGDAWVEIGSYSADASYFCEFERKWEFCYDLLTLFVRCEEFEAAANAWEAQQSQPLCYNPFSPLTLQAFYKHKKG